MQLRWYHWYITDDNGVNHEKKKLQYRQQYDKTVYAGFVDIKMREMVWSEWTDVSDYWED